MWCRVQLSPDRDCSSGICDNLTCAQPVCGDGVVNGDEQCDDGNDVSADGCEADCTLPTCGNEVIDPGEGSCDCLPGTANLDDDAANGCECIAQGDLDDTCDGMMMIAMAI